MSDDLEFRIAKLELQAGDVLVVKGIGTPSNEQHQRVSRMLPHGVKLLYIPPEVELSVLTKAEQEAAA